LTQVYCRYQLPLVTGTHIQQGTNFSTQPIWWLSFSIQQKINDYSLLEVPLLVKNTQSRVTSSTPVRWPSPLYTLAPCLHLSFEPYRVPSAESFSVLPHYDCSDKNHLKKSCAYLFPLQCQVITSPILAAGWSADHSKMAAFTDWWPQGFMTL